MAQSAAVNNEHLHFTQARKRTHFCEITAGYFMPQMQPLRFTVSLKIEELLAVQ